MGKLLFLSLIVYLINIPFGYWRANVKKYSWPWILAIHVPVLIVILIRITSHLGFAWYTYVFMVSAFFFGQQSGVYIYKRLKNSSVEVGSSMLKDLISYRKQKSKENKLP